MTPLSDSFVERVEILLDELALAIRWDRPSILLALYASEGIRALTEAALAARLAALGQQVVLYRVTGETSADVPLLLAQHTERAYTVFFVSGLKWGGGNDGRNAYRALNIRREYLVDHRIRAVFWLTEREARDVAYFAPDFWAFRHRVVDFIDLPDPPALFRMGDKLLHRSGRGREVREELEASIAWREALLAELPDGDSSTRLYLLDTLTDLYRRKHEWERALSVAQQALALASRLNEAQAVAAGYGRLGDLYDEMGQYEEAITAYQRALALDERNAAYYQKIGSVYASIGRTEEAVAAYERAIALAPKNPAPWLSLGGLYHALERYEEAIAAYQHAIALDPTTMLPHVGLGVLYRRLGHYEAALGACLRAVALAPKDAWSHSSLGDVYFALERYEEALAAYEQASHLDPEDAWPPYKMGDCYRQLGRHEEALAAYERASHIDPQNGGVYVGMGEVYQRLGRYEEAVAAFGQADAVANSHEGGLTL